MRCALVEFTLAHGETLPTFVYLLNNLGVDVDVYVRPPILESDPFAHCPGLKCTVSDLEGLLTRARIRIGHFGRYDFVLANSAEPSPLLARLAAIRVPLIGVVHNAVLLDEDDGYRRFFSSPSRQPLALGRHVTTCLDDAADVRWVAPVHVMERRDPTAVCWHRFCVQGRVDFRRRNYWGLLDAVEELKTAGVDGFEVDLVGGDRALDGVRLRRASRQRALDVFFTRHDGRFRYGEYFRRISSAGFVLPLVDSSSPVFQPYFEDKITSSISMALGTGSIPVVHQRLAELYGLVDLAIGYPDGGLAAAMKTALDLSEESRLRMAERIEQERRALLDESLDNLASVIGELGLTPPA
jgi:hypothetical protein